MTLDSSDATESSTAERTEPKLEKPDDDIDFDEDDDDYFNIDDVKFDFDDEIDDEGNPKETADVKVPVADSVERGKGDQVGSHAESARAAAPANHEDDGNHVGQGAREERSGEEDDYADLGIIGKLEGVDDDEEGVAEVEEGVEMVGQEIHYPVDHVNAQEATHYYENYGEEGDGDYASFADDYLLVNGLKPCYVPLDRLDIDPEDVPFFTHVIKPKRMMKGQTKFRSAAVVKQETWV